MADTGFVVPKDKQGRIAQGFTTDPDTCEPVRLLDATTAPETVDYMAADHLGPGIGPGTNYVPGPGDDFGLGFTVRRPTGVADVNGSEGDGGLLKSLVLQTITEAPKP
jgi:hypothetical protein